MLTNNDKGNYVNDEDCVDNDDDVHNVVAAADFDNDCDISVVVAAAGDDVDENDNDRYYDDIVMIIIVQVN